MFDRINRRLGSTSARRIAAVTAATACTAAAVVLAGGSASAAPPVKAPHLAATLSHDRNCLFTATATWRNVAITQIYGSWYYDDETLSRFTTESPGGVLPNWTFSRSRATMNAGPADQAGDPHRWSVLVHFYEGTRLAGQVTTAVDTALCKMNPPDPV